MKDNLFDKLTITAEKYNSIPAGGYFATGSSITLGLPFSPKRYLQHGWQSWSLTAWVETVRYLPPTRPFLLTPMQTDPVYARVRNHNGSWYGAVEATESKVLLLGALDLEAHVELDGDQLKGWYENGVGDWVVCMGDETQVMNRYAGLLEARFGKGRISRPPRIWCSWYSLYTEIHETHLLKILGDLEDFPFDVFQIDDGWQKSIGDWEANKKFPSGMQYLAERVKETGRTPGLWLAPLLVVPSSPVYQDHQDWLLHDERNRLVSAGYNWSEPLFALDTTHPDALTWLAALMKKVRTWGYEYAKLDFLYAGALPGKRAGGLPREAAFRKGLQVIREALGDAYLLTCGTPILPSLGLCDGMRVGPDVAEYWDNFLYTQLMNNYAATGANSAIRTVLNRLWLKPLVNTDPDVVYFRSAQNNLTLDQMGVLQDLAQVAGFRATSDIPSWLTELERNALREFLESDSTIARSGRTSFQIDEHTAEFGPFAQLPPSPNFAVRLLSALVGGLASNSLVMKVFDDASRKEIRKKIAAHPV